MAKRRRTPQKRRHEFKYEFKPDPKGTNFLKKLYMTRLQRLQVLKWGTYALTCIFLLVIQDVIMSRFRFSGATTDLAVCIILLIGIFEGLEIGSLFVLIASTIYWFSGSAPGTYVIALMTILTVGINLFRQTFWRRSFGSTTLCTGIAIMVYEIAIFLIGIFSELTIWPRAIVFVLTGVMTCIVMLPLYPLVAAIAKIGGDTWKE